MLQSKLLRSGINLLLNFPVLVAKQKGFFYNSIVGLLTWKKKTATGSISSHSCGPETAVVIVGGKYDGNRVEI